MNVFITGPPGSGKSTLVERIVERLGMRVGGMRTPEMREGGERKGFAIVDVRSGRRGVLASKEMKEGPRLGKYRINIVDLEEIGVRALEEAVGDEGVELIIIDEIGRMEFFSKRFGEAVERCLSSGKPVLAVLHRDYVERYSKRGVVFDLGKDDPSEVLVKASSLLRNK